MSKNKPKFSNKKTILLLSVTCMFLISCGKAKDAATGDDSVSDSASLVESSITAISGVADDQSESSYAYFTPIKSKYDLINQMLIEPTFAANCSRALASNCNNGVRSATLSSCTLGASNLKATGDINLTYSSSSCDMSATNATVTRTYNYDISGPRGGGVITNSSDSHTDYNGNQIGGGAGLSLYGVQLAKKGVNVHAFNAQNFISAFNNFFDSVFLSKFIPSSSLGNGRETYSYANFIKATVHEGKLDFPIDGYILNHVAEILGQKYELNKYTVGFPITTSAEVAEMRIYLHKLAKDYLKLLESLKGHNKFNYHVMFDDQFFKNVPVSSIDRYIVFNGAFYYKRNKINYLDTLLNSLSPGGQALLVLDNGVSRFKVGELSLGEYLASKWPEIFSVEHVTNYGM